MYIESLDESKDRLTLPMLSAVFGIMFLSLSLSAFFVGVIQAGVFYDYKTLLLICGLSLMTADLHLSSKKRQDLDIQPKFFKGKSYVLKFCFFIVVLLLLTALYFSHAADRHIEMKKQTVQAVEVTVTHIEKRRKAVRFGFSSLGSKRSRIALYDPVSKVHSWFYSTPEDFTSFDVGQRLAAVVDLEKKQIYPLEYEKYDKVYTVYFLLIYFALLFVYVQFFRLNLMRLFYRLKT